MSRAADAGSVGGARMKSKRTVRTDYPSGICTERTSRQGRACIAGASIRVEEGAIWAVADCTLNNEARSASETGAAVTSKTGERTSCATHQSNIQIHIGCVVANTDSVYWIRYESGRASNAEGCIGA